MYAHREFHENKFTTKGVVARCRKCRSEDYYRSQYPLKCGQCLHHRPLDCNKVCRRCNAESGLKQCRRCGDLLPLMMQFYEGKGRCKGCLRAVRTCKGADDLVTAAPSPSDTTG